MGSVIGQGLVPKPEDHFEDVRWCVAGGQKGLNLVLWGPASGLNHGLCKPPQGLELWIVNGFTGANGVVYRSDSGGPTDAIIGNR